METTIRVEGMSCGNCAAKVEKALQELSGVSAEVDLESGTARVNHPEGIAFDDLADAVKAAGYSPVGPEEG